MTRKKALAVMIVVCVLAGAACVGLLLPALPLTNYQTWRREVCSRCGMLSYVRESGLWQDESTRRHFRSLELTPLSKWHTTKISGDCRHEWEFNHNETSHSTRLFGFELRSGATESGGRSVPSLVELSPEDRARLEGLLRQNPEACQDYITKRLTDWWWPRAVAHVPRVKAALAVHPEYTDIEVLCTYIDRTRVAVILVYGPVRSTEEETRLRSIVSATKPPVDIYYEITVEAPGDGPTK